jgi:hypothetical protein
MDHRWISNMYHNGAKEGCRNSWRQVNLLTGLANIRKCQGYLDACR